MEIKKNRLDAQPILFLQTMPFLEFDNANLFYETAGQGPAFVMLHAGIAHSAMWDPQFAFFKNEYRVVRFDQRGFGKTTTTTKTFNRRADVRALLDHLRIERAIVMGCSMGGSLAVDFALEYPDRVAALILIAAGVSGNPPTPELSKAWAEQDAALAAGEIERCIELELQMWVDGPQRTPEQTPSHVREKIRAMELDNLKINTDGYESVPLDPPALNRLGEIRVPTLILIGEYDQPHVNALAPKLAHDIPNARLIEIANTAHVPSMEKPNEVNRVIQEFLLSNVPA